jgi:hypothetical protein
MLTIRKDKCIPEKRKIGDPTPPNYICLSNGDKHYISKDEKKDYLYGGECPKFCPVKGVVSNCPNVAWTTDNTIARNTCEADTTCTFIANSVLDRSGPNYCIPKVQKGCITLTEADLAKSDKELTDNASYCNRYNKGCIFNRGNGDNLTTRKGEPTCLRGCLGSKYWKNPKYMWGGGDTTSDPFTGAWYNNDLEVGPKYLEESPSAANPNGWGGPSGTPWFGNGKLPKSLGIPLTESQGKYEPPCNISGGDVGVFTSSTSGELLAGPGCKLTSPQPRFGLQDWSYTCGCPYLGGTGEFKPDAWEPCADWELDQEKISKRDVCTGCHILDDPESKMNGTCVLGNRTKDTESELLGCVSDPSNKSKCRINRIIEPTSCPAFCSNDTNDPYGWRKNTQCSAQLTHGCWKPNPAFRNIITKAASLLNQQSKPYVKLNSDNKSCKTLNTDYLCRNCAQTSMKSRGSGTKYPVSSSCVVGGNDSDLSLTDTGYSDYLARSLTCPSTCNQCMSGFFGEPLDAQYNIKEASDTSSVFRRGIIYTPSTTKQTFGAL